MVVKMLATIVLLFGLCWLPLHLFITITTTFKKNFFGDLVYDIYFSVHWLSMANSFVNPVVYGFMNENFRIDLRSLAATYICYCCGHRRLRYRPAAVRWRLGDSNVHDTKLSSTHSYICETISRGEVELQSMTSHQKKNQCRNGQRTEMPAINVSKKYFGHIHSDNDSSSGGRKNGNGTGRSIFVAGRRKHYDLCRKNANLHGTGEENGATLLQSRHTTDSEECNECHGHDLHPVVRFDGSHVGIFTDHNKKGQG